MTIPSSAQWASPAHQAVHWTNDDGSFESRTLADPELSEWLEAGRQPAEAAPPAPVTVVTRSQFLALFTKAEMLAILTAAQQNAEIHLWIITAQAEAMIDLGAAETKTDLDALVTAELLTAPRETAILANQLPG